MSNQVHYGARPEGAWSGPAFFEEARRLHEHYALFCRGVAKQRLSAIAKTTGAFLYESEAPLSDGYLPCLTLVIKVASGKIAVVFPRFGGYVNEDGTNTERSTTIHYAGAVVQSSVASVVAAFINGLPPLREVLGTVSGSDELQRAAERRTGSV